MGIARIPALSYLSQSRTKASISLGSLVTLPKDKAGDDGWIDSLASFLNFIYGGFSTEKGGVKNPR